MGIKEAASGIVDSAKAVFDKNEDGNVEAKEVVEVIADRFVEAGNAIGEAAGEVKKGFDADEDGKVSLDEVKVVASGVAQKASGAVSGLVDKIAGPKE